MNILVVGGGGREHAIIKKLRENERVETIYALPGNGGIAQDAVCTGIAATDLDGIAAFARENPVDFAVIAPDDPLVLGLADRLRGLGIPCFGPSAKAAAIEGSKVFAKDLMRKYGIPTARYQVFLGCDEENQNAFGLALTPRGAAQTIAGTHRIAQNLFAAGDVRTGQSLVVRAIADGRAAAGEVDAYLCAAR